MIDELPDQFLNDFGVPVVFGNRTVKGILDMPTEVLSGNMVLSTDYQLTFKTSALPGLGYGSAITVNRVAYTVKSVRQVDDGTFSIADIQKN
jgi:hypothetical protein